MKNLILISALAAVVALALPLHGCSKKYPTISFHLYKTGRCDVTIWNNTKDDILYLPFRLDVDRWSTKGKELKPIYLDLTVFAEKPIAVLPGQTDVVSYLPYNVEIGPANAGEKWAITAEIDWKKGAKQREMGWKILGGGDWDPTEDQAE